MVFELKLWENRPRGWDPEKASSWRKTNKPRTLNAVTTTMYSARFTTGVPQMVYQLEPFFGISPVDRQWKSEYDSSYSDRQRYFFLDKTWKRPKRIYAKYQSVTLSTQNPTDYSRITQACWCPPRRNDFFYISETNRASNFTIYHDLALDSLYISTGNDVINYFRSAANRTNVFILAYVRFAIST